jgi:hypothetical protein
MDAYDADDAKSMADNNTSALNHREITGGGLNSLHSYGLAIDINPVQNPYVKRSGEVLSFSPQAGIDYANRLNLRPGRLPRPGMAEEVVDVFADHGFAIWGGYWDNPIDYQHFEVGRAMAEKLAGSAPSLARGLFAKWIESYRQCRRKNPGVKGRSVCIEESSAPEPGAQ